MNKEEKIICNISAIKSTKESSFVYEVSFDGDVNKELTDYLNTNGMDKFEAFLDGIRWAFYIEIEVKVEVLKIAPRGSL